MVYFPYHFSHREEVGDIILFMCMSESVGGHRSTQLQVFIHKPYKQCMYLPLYIWLCLQYMEGIEKNLLVVTSRSLGACKLENATNVHTCNLEQKPAIVTGECVSIVFACV